MQILCDVKPIRVLQCDGSSLCTLKLKLFRIKFPLRDFNAKNLGLYSLKLGSINILLVSS